MRVRDAGAITTIGETLPKLAPDERETAQQGEDARIAGNILRRLRRSVFIERISPA